LKKGTQKDGKVDESHDRITRINLERKKRRTSDVRPGCWDRQYPDNGKLRYSSELGVGKLQIGTTSVTVAMN